ncbi:hypothetical protein PAPHI01_1209 [Pancytospora philotis]|nr:hypothetical protein PAPHI01_1209 [Pancytospora philotis]
MFAVIQRMLAVLVTGSRAGASPDLRVSQTDAADLRTLEQLVTRCQEHEIDAFATVRPEKSCGCTHEMSTMAGKKRYVLCTVYNVPDFSSPGTKLIDRCRSHSAGLLDMLSFEELVFLRGIVTRENALYPGSTTGAGSCPRASAYECSIRDSCYNLAVIEKKLNCALEELMNAPLYLLVFWYEKWVSIDSLPRYIAKRYADKKKEELRQDMEVIRGYRDGVAHTLGWRTRARIALNAMGELHESKRLSSKVE